MNAITSTITRTARAFAIKGLLTIAFGLVLAVWPGPTVAAILFTFSVFAIVDGAVSLWDAATTAPDGQRRSATLSGVASVGAGVVSLAWPGITALALLYVIGVWALVKGGIEIAAAVSASKGTENRGLVGAAGAAATLFGAVMLVHPGRGAVALVSLIAALAVVTGVTFLAAGVGMGRRAHKVNKSPERLLAAA